jgi:hypothetical protein
MQRGTSNQASQNAGTVVPSQPTANSNQAGISPEARAAKTINDTLAQELRYPELDNYVTRKLFS